MPICEGCGARVDDAHVLRRKQRVDLAMRFRPTQIKILLLNAAPPELEADYFYRSPGSLGSFGCLSHIF